MGAAPRNVHFPKDFHFEKSFRLVALRAMTLIWMGSDFPEKFNYRYTEIYGIPEISTYLWSRVLQL